MQVETAQVEALQVATPVPQLVQDVFELVPVLHVPAPHAEHVVPFKYLPALQLYAVIVLVHAVGVQELVG